MKKRILSIVFLFVFAVLSASCSGSLPNSETSHEGGVSGDVVTLTNAERKIVYIVTTQIETDNINEAKNTIKDETIAAEGYIERSDIENNSASYTLRIKTENLNSFLDNINGIGRIHSQNTTSEDITLSYVDVTSKIEAYEREIELLEQYCQGETDPDVIIKYTQRISELNDLLFNYQSQLNLFDSMVEYSTVNIYLYGKGSVIPTLSYDRKIEQVFNASINFLLEVLKFLFLAIVALAPYAVIALVLFFGIKYLLKFLRKRYPEKFKNKKTAKINIRQDNEYNTLNKNNNETDVKSLNKNNNETDVK